MSLGIIIIAALVGIILTIASIISLVFWFRKEKKAWKISTHTEKILIAIILVLWLLSFGTAGTSTEFTLLLLIVSVVIVSILFLYRRKKTEKEENYNSTWVKPPGNP